MTISLITPSSDFNALTQVCVCTARPHTQNKNKPVKKITKTRQQQQKQNSQEKNAI
jgi:hypothetical protein